MNIERIQNVWASCDGCHDRPPRIHIDFGDVAVALCFPCLREMQAAITSHVSDGPSKECVRPAHTFVGASVYLSGDDVCDFPDCGRVRAQGQRYCKMHRQREVRHGDPSIVMKVGRKKQAR